MSHWKTKCFLIVDSNLNSHRRTQNKVKCVWGTGYYSKCISTYRWCQKMNDKTKAELCAVLGKAQFTAVVTDSWTSQAADISVTVNTLDDWLVRHKEGVSGYFFWSTHEWAIAWCAERGCNWMDMSPFLLQLIMLDMFVTQCRWLDFFLKGKVFN